MKRILLLVACAAVLLGTWLSPLPVLANLYFSARTALLLSLATLASPLLALALGGGKFDPVRRWPQAFPPMGMLVGALLATWFCHTPEWYHLARTYPMARACEQLCFFAAGFLVFLSAFGGDVSLRQSRSGRAIIALFLTSFQFIALGALLVFTTETRYLHAHYFDETYTGLIPLDDQHLGGALLVVIGGSIPLAACLWLLQARLRARYTQSVS